MKAGINQYKSESFINTENKEMYLVTGAGLAQFLVLKNTATDPAWAMLGHGLGHVWQFG